MQCKPGSHLHAVDEEYIPRLVEIRLSRELRPARETHLESRLNFNRGSGDCQGEPLTGDTVKLCGDLVSDSIIIRQFQRNVHLVRLELVHW